MNPSFTANLDPHLDPPPVACIGLDWGDKTHAFALQGPGPLETGTVGNSPEQLHLWLRTLGDRFGGQPVALAVETSRGPLIHLFSAYPWLSVYPIHPATSHRYRQAFTPSGAKQDAPDAVLLLELVQLHRSKLRQLEPQDEQTRTLAALVELRRDQVNRRAQLVNQLIALLKSYYPQALELAGVNLTTAMALDFLDRWPDLLALKRARPGTLRRFYYGHGVRAPQLVQERLQLAQASMALTADPAVVGPARLHLRALVAHLRRYGQDILELEEEIERLFKTHAEAYLFRNLPGAGEALRPRLLVAFGTDRALYPDAASLQKFAGIAPVIEQSGNKCWIHWRWHAPMFLRQTFVEWVPKSLVHCSWARAYYQAMSAQGKSHHVIVRALAFKWIRILWKCWQTRTAYSEEFYLKRLRERNSPYAVTG